MELKDVAIVDFNFFSGLKGPVIRAMAQFIFDELDSPQIVWVDLTPEEKQVIIAVARAVEQRFLSKETPVPEEAKRSIGFRTPRPDE